MRSAWRRLAGTSIALWSSTVVAFIGGAVAARALGPNEYGAAVLALATAALVSMFLDIALDQALVFHGFKALAEDDVPGLLSLIRNAVVIELGAGLIVTGLVVGLAGPIAEVATGGHLSASIIQIAALNGLATTLDPATGAVLQLAERPQNRAWSMAFANVSRVIFMLAAIALGAGAEGIVIATVIGSAAGATFQAAWAWRLARRRWPVRARRGEFRHSARTLMPFAFHSTLMTTLLSAGTSIIPVVLGRFAGQSAVGLFKVAQLPTTVSSLASSPIQLVMYGEMTKRAASQSPTALRGLIARWTRIGVAIAAPGAIAGFFLLPVLIPAIYGSAFRGAVGTAQILLIPAFVGFGFGWMKNFFVATGRPAVGSGLALVPLLIAVPVTALLANAGSVAAAVAVAASVVVSWLAELVITWRWFRRQQAKRGSSDEPAPASQMEPVEMTLGSAPASRP